MTKPPTSVRSVRLRDDLWAQLGAEASRRGTNINALVASLVEQMKTEDLVPRDFRPSLDRAAARTAAKVTAHVQVGPAPVAPGSRLKKR